VSGAYALGEWVRGPGEDLGVFRYHCGCEYRVTAPPAKEGALPYFEFDQDNFPICRATFALLASGRTKGVFQLESSLGRHWTKRLRPENADQIGALGAILRPGCLKAKSEDGVSMTERFCRRKNREEEAEAYHPALAPILSSTFQVITYQEQLMRMGKELAGFDLVEVDKLRKAVGKKDQQELAKVKTLFLAGCTRLGIVTDEQAATIWGWIEKSGRYLFNRSHSQSYGLLGYSTAYLKTHDPVSFFANWLYYAKDKSDPREEISELVADAKLLDQPVEPPDIRDLEERVSTDMVAVRFGLCDVREVGPSRVEKLRRAAEAAEAVLGRPLREWTWEEFLFHCGHETGHAATTGWIAVGAFRWTGKKRARLLNEYRAWAKLTEAERKWVLANCRPADGVTAALRAVGRPKKDGGGAANKNRVALLQGEVKFLEDPPASEADWPNQVAADEEHYLGVALTCSRVEACDLGEVNCTCKEFLAGRVGKLALGVRVCSVRVIKTKKGDKMAFLSVEDASCGMDDVCVFPEAWERYEGVLRVNNNVLLRGGKDPKKDSFVVDRVYQL
jgi:DNA polymerase-3 subunit alpha